MRCDAKPCGRERRNGRRGGLRRGAAPRPDDAEARDATAREGLRRGAATTRDRSLRRVLALALGACALGGAAMAQEPEAAAGPVVERIRSGFVIAPDLKVTGVDGGSGPLAGLYGGFVTDRRLLLGAGAYWLTGGPGSVDLAYGGGLVEWFANPGGRLDVSVRSLFGAGRATLTSDFETFITGAGTAPLRAGLLGAGPAAFEAGAGIAPLGPFPGPAGLPGRWGHGPKGGRAWRADHPPWEGFPWEDFPWLDGITFRYHEHFLVAEPQISVHWNASDWLRVGGGAGYRFVGRAGSDGGRLRGFTAGVGLQLGPP